MGMLPMAAEPELTKGLIFKKIKIGIFCHRKLG